jgi:hypothetical protein
MISVVLYGRNDSHGYNLHKRAALSLNAIAATLDHADDEILFVDYNTPDDLPSFPEAIQDTLTPQAQARLRILRVRHARHRRLGIETRLQAIEPIARNVALRRSNPANRWVLSTNTDVVPATTRGESLSALAAGLPAGFHGAPRVDIPETLWETLDRRDAQACIAAMRDWGRRFHLDDFVRGQDFFGYDNPGDFQLAERADLVAIDGFDEAMVLGWHVDSNLARRLWLNHGPPGDLADRLVCYHCDHTRQATFGHQQATSQNSFEDFVHRVERPDLPHQRGRWGLAGEEVEEIRLPAGAGARYIAGLDAALPEPLEQPLQSRYTPESFGRSDAPAGHILPYLLDLIASQPPSTRIAWFGQDGSGLCRLVRALDGADFASKVLVEAGGEVVSGLPADLVEPGPRDGMLAAADLVILDFTGVAGEDAALTGPACRLLDAFWAVRAHERARLADPLAPPRLIVGVNVVHSPFEPIFTWNLGAVKSPFSARLRHGYIADRAPAADWLPLMNPGAAGLKRDGVIASRPGCEGVVAGGPHAALPPGCYEMAAKLVVGRPTAFAGASATTILRRLIGRSTGARARHGADAPPLRPAATLRVAAGPAILAQTCLVGLSLRSRTVRLPFEMPALAPGQAVGPGVQLVVLSNGLPEFSLSDVICRPRPA